MKQKKDTAVVYIITKMELGGAQKVCLSLFNGVAEQDIDTIIISGTEGKLVNQISEHPHAILLNEFKREVSGFGLWHELKTVYKLIQTLRTLKKQYRHLIVHTHSTKAGILGRLAAWLAGIDTRVHTIHGYAFHEHQPKILYAAIVALEWCMSIITTHFVCVSSHDAALGKRLFPRFAKKYSMIRAAVDWQQMYQPARYTPWQDTEQLFIFGTIACFKPQKNLFDLLQAFKQVHEHLPHTRLEIIGDGIQRTAIENWIATHALEHAITLHGWQEQVGDYLRTWHAFVLSSLWEGLPCAIIEARLNKLPVVAYNTGGIYDVIKHGQNGFLCPQKEWRLLADAMAKLVKEPDLYSTLQSYNDTLEDFKNQTMVLEHKKMYKNLKQRSVV